MTVDEAQGCYPSLYVDGERQDLDVFDPSSAEGGSRVQVEWDAVSNGYVVAGWTCGRCGESFEEQEEAREHLASFHGVGVDDEDDPDDELTHADPLVNSCAIDWTGDDVTVTISTGDPRGAFAMTVRRLNDGTRVLHVPHPSGSLLHEELTELHPGTYRIGG